MRSGIFVQLHGVMYANACMCEHVVHEATSRSSLKSRGELGGEAGGDGGGDGGISISEHDERTALRELVA